MVRDPESRAGRETANHHRRARRRQCSEEILAGTVVADRRDEALSDRLCVHALSDNGLADAPKPDFDHFAPFDHFKGLIAQRIAEQHAQFVRLTGAEVPLRASEMPGDGCRLPFNVDPACWR